MILSTVSLIGDIGITHAFGTRLTQILYRHTPAKIAEACYNINIYQPKHSTRGLTTMSKLYKNWTAHNLIGHPLSEIAYLLGFSEEIYNWIHDVTIPPHKPGTGRG